MAKTYNSGSYISTDNGKFRLEVTASLTNAGIVCTPKIHVSDAFSHSQKFELSYYANNKTAKTKKKLANNDKTVKKSGTYKFTPFTISWGRVTHVIKLKINGKTAKINANTIVSSTKPDAPNVTVERVQPTRWKITVKAKGKNSQPINKVYLEYTNVKNPQDGDWSSLNYDTFSATTDSHTSEFMQEINLNEYYIFRARVSGDTSGTERYSSWTRSDTGYVSRPDEAEDVAMDEETATITWSANLSDIDKKIVTGWNIYRAEGETFTLIDSVEAEEGQVYYSWTESSQLVGHSFKYKVVPYNDYGESWDSSAIEVSIEGAPYAPSSTQVHYYYNEDGSVVISVDLTDGVEHTYIESSTDGTTWTQIADLTAPANSYTDMSATSNTVYRVRFGNDSGYSEYSDTYQPAEKVKPDEPTILIPVNDTYVALDNGSIDIIWQHNSRDNSPQKARKLRYYINNAWTAWTTVTTTDSSYTYDISSLSSQTMKIQLQTQGDNGLWSDSSEVEVKLCTAPSLIIDSPTGLQTSLPLVVEFIYTDDPVFGAFEEIYLDAIDEEGDVIYSTSTDDSSITEISLMGALFEPEIEYTLQMSARSITGLTASYITTFTVEYSDEVLEGSLYPVVDNDEETGYAYINISREIADDDEDPITPADIVHAYLYRNSNAEKVLIQEVEEGMTVIDKYAPVNESYEYELLQLYEDGNASKITVDAVNPCPYSFIYWGKNYDKIAYAQWNPSQSTSLSRPEKTLVRYSGRQYPVAYDSKARQETATFNADLEFEELQDFIRMMNAGGTGIWKSVQGRTFLASFDLDFERVDNVKDLYKCSLRVTRIEGD